MHDTCLRLCFEMGRRCIYLLVLSISTERPLLTLTPTPRLTVSLILALALTSPLALTLTQMRQSLQSTQVHRSAGDRGLGGGYTSYFFRRQLRTHHQVAGQITPIADTTPCSRLLTRIGNNHLTRTFVCQPVFERKAVIFMASQKTLPVAIAVIEFLPDSFYKG